jgi:peptidoglycan/xylan/chitin deacetylase (PgdA/CDA1 family)
MIAIGCADPPAAESNAPAPPPATVASAAVTAPPATRPQLDGHGFPDKVLALTWDDGPDADTFELAEYLAEHHVSATFFVVGAWVDGVSAEPGKGRGVFDTGHERIPELGDLVALGHRVANHTENHVILSDADAATVAAQLRENQARIDRWITNDLRLFRAPGGAWNAAASAAVDADPATRGLVGPIRWDIDGKDWECSLYCRSSAPAAECEPAAPGHHARVKPAVVAKRYLAAIEARGHGVVLFHDRVGHVGSRYALDLAHALIPELIARGYVFAAPVLRFSHLAPRAIDLGGGALLTGDLNGDGRADTCAIGEGGVSCRLASARGLTGAAVWLDAGDLDAAGVERDTLRLGDVNGDGRADLCGRGADGVVCALAP